MLDELLPDVLAYLQDQPLDKRIVSADDVAEALRQMGKPCPLQEHGVSRCIKVVLEQLFGIASEDAIGANVATVLEFGDMEGALAELHTSYDADLASKDRALATRWRREVVRELIRVIWSVHERDEGVALPMSTGAGQMKRGQIFLWHPGASRLLYGGGSISTVKASVYTGLLLSKAHETRYRGPLNVVQQDLTDDDKAKVVGVLKARHGEFVASMLELGLSVPDTDELYFRRTKALVSEAKNLGGLMEALGDGAIPVAEFEGNSWQARTFAGKRPEGLSLIGKGLVTKAPTLVKIFRELGVCPSIATCLTGNTKVGSVGVHENGMVVTSQFFTPRPVESEPVQLGQQMLRFEHGSIVPLIMGRTGWTKSIRRYAHLWMQNDMAGWRKAMNVKPHSVGLKAMLVDGVERTVLWPLVKALLGRTVLQRTVNHKMRGTFAPISPEPALPLVVTTDVAGTHLNLMPILAPSGIGFELGNVVWMKRNPTVTPGSNVPAIIVGFTDDATVGVHPLAVKWNLRGDFDGDEVALYQVGTLDELGGEDTRWLDILRSFSRSVYRVLWRALHGEVKEPVMVARSEKLNAESYGEFVSDLLFDANYLLGSCDAWTTLLCNWLQESGLNPEEATFKHAGQELDAYSFFCLLEAHTDTFKKRPKNPAFHDSDEYATTVCSVKFDERWVRVPLKDLREIRVAFSQKTPDRLQDAAAARMGKLAEQFEFSEYVQGLGRPSALMSELTWIYDERGFFDVSSVALNAPDCSYRVWAYDHERMWELPEDSSKRAKLMAAARKGRLQVAAYWASCWTPDVFREHAPRVLRMLGDPDHPKSCIGLTAKTIKDATVGAPEQHAIPDIGLESLWYATQDLLSDTFGGVKELVKWAFQATPRTPGAKLWPRDVFASMERLFGQDEDGEYTLSPSERNAQLEDLFEQHIHPRGLGFFLLLLLNRTTYVPTSARYPVTASAWFSRIDLARRVIPAEAWRVIVARACDSGFTLSEDDLTEPVMPAGEQLEADPDSDTRLDVVE